MSPRKRPPRAWLGEPRQVDPRELLGPRGLTQDVLDGKGLDDLDDAPGELQGDDAFYASLLTEQRRARIEAVIAARLGSVTAVLDQLIDPHNVAAIVRSSEGLGLCEVHLVHHTEQDSVAHRRVTRDADKWIDLTVHETGPLAVLRLRAEGFSVWAGHLDGEARLLEELPVDRPIALLLGNEHEGPSEASRAACDGTFRIPMQGFTQSFNVSVAGAVALYTVARARRAALGREGDLNEAARARLRSRYLKLGAKLARRISAPPQQG
jgi:tRNA (guanosine-2'-O-)-methyltransferase